MALSATTIAECQIGSSDTTNAGLFDPAQVSAGGWTDGAATSATGNSPVFSSASYNFVAGDVGAWVYITSGTNWTPGWYQIASVATNVATLTATIGTAVLAGATGLNTVAGCATTASPTGAVWSIDYSQQTAAQVTYTDLASTGAGLTVSSATKPFGRHQVGNGIIITGGTNFNTGRYVIASVAAVTFIATVVGPTNITSGAGATGTGSLGGALLSPAVASSIAVAGMTVFIKYNASAFAVTSASANVSGGLFQPAAVQLEVQGYDTSRTLGNSNANRPTLQASGISTFIIIAIGNANTNVRNIICDGNSLTGSAGFNGGGRARFYNCKGINCKNVACTGSGTYTKCEATGCATQPAFSSANCVDCESHGNTVTGFSGCTTKNCYSYSNSGGSSIGFSNISNSSEAINCVAYGNGSDGFSFTGIDWNIYGCIAENNAGFGFNGSAGHFGTLYNCATYNNTSGGVATGLTDPLNSVTLVTAGSVFVNAASGNFALNNTTNQGALLRAANTLLNNPPAGTTVGYVDIGPTQHQDSPSATNIFPIFD